MKPIPQARTGVGKLALELRHGRARSGLSRDRLAGLIRRSVTTIQRAESGKTRLPWPVTRDIATACALDLEDIEMLWKNACWPIGGTRLTPAPKVELVRTPHDLAAALRRVWEEAGEPSLRQMENRAEDRARQYVPLSRMTAQRIRERQHVPSSIQQLFAYLYACGVPETSFTEWARAWQRAAQYVAPIPKAATVVAGEPSRKISSKGAADVMLAAGLTPLDEFPGPAVPWSARCRKCKKISRFLFYQVENGTQSCRACAGGALI